MSLVKIQIHRKEGLVGQDWVCLTVQTWWVGRTVVGTLLELHATEGEFF